MLCIVGGIGFYPDEGVMLFKCLEGITGNCFCGELQEGNLGVVDCIDGGLGVLW